jgi:hypothetical protein
MDMEVGVVSVCDADGDVLAAPLPLRIFRCPDELTVPPPQHMAHSIRFFVLTTQPHCIGGVKI